MERNKGKLIPTGIDTSDFSEDDFEMYWENGFIELDGELYTCEWEVRKGDGHFFADVKENEDGTINFHVLHHNGGGSLTEIIESKLN